MRVIHKGKPPTTLTKHRAEPVGASYENLPKQEVRDALAKEQGYLCAYCMGRMKADEAHMKIDHRTAQNPNVGEGATTALDYRNMLGVCKGGEGLPRDQQHCDTYKGNRALRIDPTDTRSGWERTIYYGANGSIVSTRKDFDEDLNKAVLNLNVDSLLEARKAAVQSVVEQMARESPGAWTEAVVRKGIKRFEARDTQGRYAPYCEAVLFFLRKRLARLAR
ncbi:hypothetical protein [Polyangium sp. 15x6]|uniref:hypothetical protein n=1 Tax=Polyangium sp. 15x6 TaxID=3042687 RepID=UPI00249B2B62|nr:hypothetical protein [Polyangium sp. 15x6]MDI3287079.1 hypothetical protein [Polyangium sp. 15x6]